MAKRISAITRVVDHHGGPVALALAMNARLKTAKQLMSSERIFRQQIEQWVERGWASPTRFQELAPFLPDGITVADLYEDRKRAKKSTQRKKTSVEKPRPSA